jgi:hypothetical protein
MYSYADRLKAVELYIKYDLNVAAVVHELGYPSRNMLRQWHQEYIETGGLHEKHGKRHSYDAWKADRDGKPTWWSLIREDIDKAVRQSMTLTQFIKHLQELGYDIKPGKYLAIKPEGKERFVRLKTLGDNYTEKAITERILSHRLPERILRPFKAAMKRVKYKGDFKRHRSSVKGLRALYFHYLYLLRKAQRQPMQRVSFLLREDIRKMHEFAAQIKLLCKYCIDTKEQRLEFIDTREAEKTQLVNQRKFIITVSGERRMRLPWQCIWAGRKRLQADCLLFMES